MSQKNAIAALLNTSSWFSVSGSGNQLGECNGETIDLLVRLRLLKLVVAVTGQSQEALPETLKLNFKRLRAVQAHIQNIIVVSTSILVCRQTLLSDEWVVTDATDMDNIVSDCCVRVLEVLSRVENACVEEIVEAMSRFTIDDDVNTEKLQSRKALMCRMLGKSLQAGDPIFEKLYRAVYLALRGVVLGGVGPKGRNLAEMALRQVGAVTLSEMVVKAAEVLVLVANVTDVVHEQRYINLIEKM